MAQPIVRGIQAVGNVDIFYQFNAGVMQMPPGWAGGDGDPKAIDTTEGIGVKVAGIRLDSEFMTAAQQIASSFVVPLLGGGGLALTNNNRTGTLTITCTRSSSPDSMGSMNMTGRNNTANQYGSGVARDPSSDNIYYDMTLLAQYQQGQRGGDSWGSTITVIFDFNGMGVEIRFMGCTVQNVAPLVLSGNDAPNYAVVMNYLDWACNFYDVTKATA